MSPPLLLSDVERFRTLVSERLGLHFDDGKRDFLATVLSRRLEENDYSPQRYLTSLAMPNALREEVHALAQELTVNETYFFRHVEQMRAFCDVAVVERARLAFGRPSLRVLSAGCAAGQEAYSLAMLIREQVPNVARWDLSIKGVDVNPSMLDTAVRGRFAAWSLRGTPDDVRQRWFHVQGRDFVLDESIRNMVSFEMGNLVEADPLLWPPVWYDVVFCRNVLMYFTPEASRAIVARIARSLVPGGFLFLGHAETLRGLSQDFHLRHTHGTFYYQRRYPSEQLRRVASNEAADAVVARSRPPLAADLDADDSWFEAIGRASQRIRALTPAVRGSADLPAANQIGEHV